jgi:hypothetical protein
VIAIAESFVWLHIHPTSQDVVLRHEACRALEAIPHASRRAIYARSCKRISENSPSTYSGE